MNHSSDSMRIARVFCLAALLVGFTVCGGCGNGKGDASPDPIDSGQDVATDDPNATNPDRGKWVDLATHPFEPGWVGGTLKLGRRSIVKSLNNLTTRFAEPVSICRHFLCPRLVMETPDRVDGKFQVQPWAARALPDVPEDGVTWVWDLRDDLTWEDGRAVTAADYEASWKLLQDTKIRAADMREKLEAVGDVKAIGPQRIQVRFKRPHYNAVAQFGLNFGIIPTHTGLVDAASINAANRHLSFGPYRIVTYEEDRLILQLRDEYRKKPFPIRPHYVERVAYRRVTDKANTLAQLKSGDLDLATISHDQFRALKTDAAFNDRCWTSCYLLPGYHFICWNLFAPEDLKFETPHPILGDVRVRRALAHLINRPRIIADHWNGRAVPVDAPFYFRSPEYDADPIPFDPKQARALLKEAGWKLDDANVLAKAGRQLRFSILYQGGVFTAVVNDLKENARKVGIIVELRPGPLRIGGRGYDAFCAGFSLRPPIEVDVYHLWHSSARKAGGANYAGIADEEVDRLVTAYRTDLDPQSRLKTRRRLSRRISELQPFTFLYNYSSAVAFSRRWANVRVHELGPQFRDFVLRKLKPE